MERIDSRSGGPTASLPDRIKDVESLRHTNRKAHIMTFIRLVRHRLPIILLIIALLGFMYCAGHCIAPVSQCSWAIPGGHGPGPTRIKGSPP